MIGRCLIVQPIDPVGWAVLRAAGIEPVSASSSDDATVAHEIRDAIAVITRSAGLAGASIDAALALRVIGNHGTGLDPVDVPRATAHGVPVVSTPEANVASVAELAVTLALAVAKNVVAADRASRSGDVGFKYGARIQELTGKTLGVVGFGRIGRRTAEAFVRGFGMSLLVHAPSARPEAIELAGGRACSLDELLAESDVVSLHVPLRPSTRGLIGAPELARMQPTAILVNTARGAVVDEKALAAALRSGRLAGAGLDVLETEPVARDHPLLALPNVILTPHIGGSSHEAARRTAESVARQVVDVLQDRRPTHLVNPEVWTRRRR